MSNKCYFLINYYYSKIRKKANTFFKRHRINIRINNKLEKKGLICNQEKGNDIIKNLISSNKPFIISRFGANELEIIVEIISKEYHVGNINKNSVNNFINNAGFFPNDTNLFIKYKNLILENINKIDVLAFWDLRSFEYIYDLYMKNIKLIPIHSLEPYYALSPWSLSLENKKVLVIHPFSKTIEKQFSNMDKIFPMKIFPEFKLITYKAIQSIGNKNNTQFNSWFDALEHMHNEIKKIDYDIALIGCGSYGMPLSFLIKEDGKQAIHIGGALQLLFGIKGRRWDNDPSVNQFYNEYWVRPLDEEKPDNANTVEGGCYW